MCVHRPLTSPTQSHYIGSYQTKAPYFADGQAAFDYVKGVPHNPLRWPLSLWADQYKKGVATVTEESLILQYCTFGFPRAIDDSFC
jgi:hypothetical protein